MKMKIPRLRRDDDLSVDRTLVLAFLTVAFSALLSTGLVALLRGTMH